MKIYIATPVNGRKEATLEEKMEAAFNRVEELKKILKAKYPDDTFSSIFDIVPFGVYSLRYMREAEIMGKCVQRVMECDAIFMDAGWMKSAGCCVEMSTASIYGKKMIKLGV